MKSRRVRHVLLSLVGALLVCIHTTRTTAAQSLDLGVSGNRFTVNGSAKFLVFVSYFDHGDASAATIYNDFQALKDRGVDGVRIFPNWWGQTSYGGPLTYAADTVIAPDGSIRQGPFDNMTWVLDRAREYGLLVDISFSAETVSWCDGCSAADRSKADLSFDAAQAGIREVAHRLSSTHYRHVMFDIQNESNIYGPGWNRLTEPQINSIVNTIASVDGGRVVMASVDQGYNRSDAGRRVRDTGQRVIAYHEPRIVNWWDSTFNWVQELRANSYGKPVYLQEPEKFDSQNSPWITAAGLRRAVEEAKRSGAAAWCFHTRAGFWLNSVSFFDNLWPTPEREFLDTFWGPLNDAPWGI